MVMDLMTLLFLGLNNSEKSYHLYCQNNINTFIVSHILQGTYYGKPSWGDYDNDGDLDLLVTGQSSTQGNLGSSPYHPYL